jgi:hypothetical protein
VTKGKIKKKKKKSLYAFYLCNTGLLLALKIRVGNQTQLTALSLRLHEINLNKKNPLL